MRVEVGVPLHHARFIVMWLFVKHIMSDAEKVMSCNNIDDKLIN